MGTDKARLPWGKGTLLDHMTSLMAEAAHPVRVVGPGDLSDEVPGTGPVEGIRTALRANLSRVNLVVAVDLPFLSPAWLSFLAGRLRESGPGLVVCDIDGHVPLCLAVHRKSSSAVEEYRNQGKKSLGDLLDVVSADVVGEEEFLKAGFDREMFRNLNTPDEYARYRPD